MRTITFTAAAAPALAGCAAMQPAEERVELRFAAMFGDAAFRCGQSYDGISTTASRVTPSDLRLYVSDVAPIDAQGREARLEIEQDGRWRHRNFALLDFEDGSGPCIGGTSDRRDRGFTTDPRFSDPFADPPAGGSAR